jgi:copper transport protein
VGAPGANRAGVAADVLEGDSFGISFAYSAGRFVDYTLMLLCVGGVAALLVVLPMAGELVRLRLQRILARAAVALTVAALIGLVLQAATAGNLSLTEAARWDPFSQVIDTKFGRWSLIRAGLALVLAVLLFVGLTRVRGPALGVVAGLVCVGMIISPVASGHASVGGTIAFLGDLTHVQMAAVWTGGLGVLILGLVLARQDRWQLASRAVPRFSNLAVGAVVALIVGGTINGLIQLGAWDAGVLKIDSYSPLVDTTYGLLLLAKIGLVIPIIALGAFNNRFSVPRLRAGIASALERRHFLRRTGAELSIMVTVIGVTAVLVNSEPPADTMEMHGPVARTVDFGEFEAHVSVEPAMPGRNEIHLEFTAKGHGAAPKIMEVRVSARLSSGKVAPMRFKAEPGHEHGAFMVPRANLPIAGDWQLQILARRGEFEALAETVSVPIEEGS